MKNNNYNLKTIIEQTLKKLKYQVQNKNENNLCSIVLYDNFYIIMLRI